MFCCISTYHLILDVPYHIGTKSRLSMGLGYWNAELIFVPGISTEYQYDVQDLMPRR